MCLFVCMWWGVVGGLFESYISVINQLTIHYRNPFSLILNESHVDGPVKAHS